MIAIADDNPHGRGGRGGLMLLVEEPDLLKELPVDGILAVTDVNHSVKTRVLEKRHIDVHRVIFGDLEKGRISVRISCESAHFVLILP